MRTWQLYLDESGDFADARGAVLVAGVLVEGRAQPQLSMTLRARLVSLFVGSAYPPHAAHHNIPTSLLTEVLAGRTPQGPAAARFLRAIELALPLARDGSSREAHALRDAVASVPDAQRLDLAPIRAFDTWLGRAAPEAHQALKQERDAQRVDLARFVRDDLTKLLVRAPIAVAAGHPRGDSPLTADARYERLYAPLVERALAFAASRDDVTELQVHLATRHRRPPSSHIAQLNQAEHEAIAFPLLRRAKATPRVVRFSAEAYGRGVAPGVVLADFASNALFSTLHSARSWRQVSASLDARLGLAAEAHCALLPLATVLPAIASAGALRDAIRAAAEGALSPPLAGTSWAREQAAAWIDALREEGAR